MPSFRPTPDLNLHYEVDDFTDPWHRPDTILMLHGNAESGLAWYGWVPALARQYRVSAKYMETVWSTLESAEVVGPLVKLQVMWRALPAPRLTGEWTFPCGSINVWPVATRVSTWPSRLSWVSA